eukprot:TRINITY_DN95336_c0_g1_i1.p1 TRINITY_DN95336_c0_g1~~TRINITY_DN95336_c0_g1_i1.p1  ORF type:complete len:431 (+),score=61.27 TRINITY_DN95336_c0_g1_i1:117-1409(+)
MKLLNFLLLVSLGFAKRLRQTKSDYRLRLTNHLNVQYSGDFTIGGQTVPVIYDTGSFEVLVLSALCSDYSSKLIVYDAHKSHTFKDLAKIAQHAFASGGVLAAEGVEKLRIGGDDSPAFAENFPFWQITQHQMPFWKTGNAIFSGIVGLSHANAVPAGFGGDPEHDKALLEHLNLDSFAICLERGSSGATPPGWLTFGDGLQKMQLDSSKQWRTIDVVGSTHWSAKLSGLFVDIDDAGVDFSRVCSPSCEALVDSGTSLLSFPTSLSPVVNKLRSMVRPDCSNIDELPNLRFQLGGADVYLPPKAWVFQVPTSSGVACKAEFMQIGAESQFSQSFILGMPFLRYYYTIFDKKKKQMRITWANEDCSIAAGASLLSSHVGVQSVIHADVSSRVKVAPGLTERDFTEATHANLDEMLLPAWVRQDATAKPKL